MSIEFREKYLKYAVAVFRFPVHENEVKIVEADTPIDAVFLSVGRKPEDYSIESKSIESVLNALFDQGFAVSVPLCLEVI